MGKVCRGKSECNARRSQNVLEEGRARAAAGQPGQGLPALRGGFGLDGFNTRCCGWGERLLAGRGSRTSFGNDTGAQGPPCPRPKNVSSEREGIGGSGGGARGHDPRKKSLKARSASARRQPAAERAKFWVLPCLHRRPTGEVWRRRRQTRGARGSQHPLQPALSRAPADHEQGKAGRGARGGAAAPPTSSPAWKSLCWLCGHSNPRHLC